MNLVLFWVKTVSDTLALQNTSPPLTESPQNTNPDTHYTANIYSGKWDARKKCKSYKYLRPYYNVKM